MRYGGPNFGTQGVVSVWEGVFPTEEVRRRQLDERNGDEFENQPLAEWMGDFGFGWFDHDRMETNFEGLLLRPIRQLIEGCSYAESFANEAVVSAEKQGVHETQTVLLLYDFGYDPEVSGIQQSKYLRFVGVFPYKK
jgi:hypothetical protein